MIGEEKGSVAISGRSSHKMTGLQRNFDRLLLIAFHRQQNLHISFVGYQSRSNSVYSAGDARDPAARWAFIFSKSENKNPSDLHKKSRLRWRPRLSRDCVERLSIKYWGHIQQGSDG